MFQRTEAVRKLFYANSLVFIATLFFPALITMLALSGFSDPNYNFIGIFTHLFVHGGILHFAFNMLALLSIGPMVEQNLGEKKFWIFYFVMGLFAAFAQSFIGGGVGASGAIFGLFAYLTCMNPDLKFAFPPLKAKWLMGLYVVFSIYAIVSGNMCGIGHFAHLGGAAAGAALFYANKHFKLG